MLDHLYIYQDIEPRSGALNMAVDEALLEDSTAPALRLYRWAKPALSLGYFGKFSDAARVGAGRELVRRWTGGGMVLHGSDLTYSLVFPTAHDCSALSAQEIYGRLHSAIRDVLIEAGICATLAISASPKISEACFANPVFADVLVAGAKVAGAAQRRTRAGLLQQGSIQYPRLPSDFVERFVCGLCRSAKSRPLDDKITRHARDIAARKYATREWLERR